MFLTRIFLREQFPSLIVSLLIHLLLYYIFWRFIYIQLLFAYPYSFNFLPPYEIFLFIYFLFVSILALISLIFSKYKSDLSQSSYSFFLSGTLFLIAFVLLYPAREEQWLLDTMLWFIKF